ncbi:hypothetical protein ERY13_06360 [Paenibacillus mucilaginosus]|nr:hypothetical protein [Paenibacillus mucilaginosus]WFA16983.1 hypothetical protein ERY13_06360 [Paenibacillus mucilaginosus]
MLLVQFPLLFLAINSIVVQPKTQQVSYPCSVVLLPAKHVLNTQGTALITKVKKPYTADPTGPLRERQSVGIYADWMTDPSAYGDYDHYVGLAQIPGVISWRFRLSPVKEDSSSFFGGHPWVGKFDEISMEIPVYARVEVRPSNSKTNELGPVILQNSLESCKHRSHSEGNVLR